MQAYVGWYKIIGLRKWYEINALLCRLVRFITINLTMCTNIMHPDHNKVVRNYCAPKCLNPFYISHFKHNSCRIYALIGLYYILMWDILSRYKKRVFDFSIISSYLHSWEGLKDKHLFTWMVCTVGRRYWINMVSWYVMAHQPWLLFHVTLD